MSTHGRSTTPRWTSTTTESARVESSCTTTTSTHCRRRSSCKHGRHHRHTHFCFGRQPRLCCFAPVFCPPPSPVPFCPPVPCFPPAPVPAPVPAPGCGPDGELRRFAGCPVRIFFECGGEQECVEGVLCHASFGFVDVLKHDGRAVSIRQERICTIVWLHKDCGPCHQCPPVSCTEE